MPPAKKQEFETVFNKLFETNIEWHRMKLEDLITLATIFSDPKILISKLGGEVEKEVARKRLIDVGVEIVEETLGTLDGPLARLYKRLAGKEEKKK